MQGIFFNCVGWPTDNAIQTRKNKNAVRLEAAMFGNRSGMYTPEELLLLRRVFENALATVPVMMRTSENQMRIARNILECAATGERDPAELRIVALVDLRVSAAA